MIFQACTWIVWRFTSIYIYIADFGQKNRNHTARRPKCEVSARYVRRKQRDRITEARQPDLDTDATPVCPVFPTYVHCINYVRI